MQNSWIMLFKSLSTLLLVVALLSVACTNVYFDKPVPQGGAPLRGFPADWPGVYVAEPDPAVGEDEVFAQIFRQCFRLERLGDAQLLVSQEYRIHETELPRLRKALEEQQRAGKLIDFRLYENMLLCTLRAEGSGQPEQQYVPLIRQGEWYILSRTVAPFYLYDLEAGFQTQYEQEKPGQPLSEWLPGADTLSSKTLRLVARRLGQGWYFNTQEEEGGGKWSLLYVEQLSKDRLVIKISNLENSSDFVDRSAYYNSITPFRKVEQSRYEIDPTDEALARLLAEPNLFQTTRLRRIAE